MKPNKRFLLTRCHLLLFIGSIFFSSCNSDFDADLIKAPTRFQESQRLIFDSRFEFNLIMKEFSESASESSTLFNQKKLETPKFVSINSILEKPDLRLKKVLVGRVFTENMNEFADSVSDLIPDIHFREFWNQNLELEINDTIYKITQYGMFFSKNADYQKMLTVIEDYKPIHQKNTADRVQLNESPLKDLGNEIYLFDSFGEELDVTSMANTENETIMYQPPFIGPLYPFGLPPQDYNKFTTYDYGAKTDLGKIFEGVFGGNSSFNENFNNETRIRVKLYAFDYLFYKSIGLNAKIQKKGWTGIWATNSDQKAEKLILGWDNILFNINIPYSMPIAFQSFPSKGVGKELLKFVNFSLSAGTITDVSIPFFKKELIDYSELEKALKGTLKTSLSKISKKIWEESESTFANASLEIKKEEIKAWRKIFPNEFKVLLSRKEAVIENANEIHLVIDRHFSISYLKNGTDQNYAEKVLKPTFDESKKKLYELDAASVYGAAIFRGQLKGIRIIKELHE